MPTARLNDIELHYELQGSGPPLVLVHGLGSGAHDWSAQIAHFAQRYTVIAPDLRGHARSTRAPGPYSIALMASDIAALLRQLKLPRAHVVGISLGGAIAFQLALDAPEAVSSITIVNSAPAMLLQTFQQKLAIWSRFVILRLFGLKKLGSIVAQRLYPGQENLQQDFVRHFCDNDPRSYKAALRALIGWNVTDRLGELRLPVLIVSADQDYTPVSLKQAYLPLIAGAKLEVLDNAHHAAPVENPPQFNAVLERFLASLPA